MKQKRSAALLIAGLAVLVFAITQMATMKNDLVLGMAFGVAIGLLGLAVYALQAGGSRHLIPLCVRLYGKQRIGIRRLHLKHSPFAQLLRK